MDQTAASASDVAAFMEDIRREREQNRQAIREVVAAVRGGEADRALQAICHAADLYISREAFLRIARLPPAAPEIQDAFLMLFTSNGDSLRSMVNDDRVLARALRVLLRSYSGPAVRLWRGELAANARYRRYGASWTVSRDVAEAFAQSEIRRQSRGGTVVLETLAPPEAILCARALHPDHLESNEQEFIVDRWKLNKVQIVSRFEPLASSSWGRK
ncbi:IncF plasmid conjugative transfer protein TraG [Hyphomicrobiales bacterium]|jgi:hypothetical protein|nr:IncF plasmid conjugative transfer protein TraG [Hyphomicrobiales bacterium]CAH1696898.1 IncF plasmid conjugative transfer protein TraG [Hyphomicrobiales bacterium]